MRRIEQIYAYVMDDDEAQHEGIPAFATPSSDILMPMMGADKSLIDRMRPLAQDAATQAGKQVRLVRFEIRTELEVLEP